MNLRTESLRMRVGKYELGRVLGEGTFAKVKYARNIETGRSYAIKILDKDKIFKEQLVEQIKREISTMKLVKHPNIVKLYEVMASKSKIYFVLEYVTGGELFNKIASRGRLKEDEARKYFQQLINAVDHCHSRRVYHRDLKPENLLLDANGNLKVSDFGLSALPQQLREDGLLHTTCGTPNYVAPEVIVHKGYDGAPADIWSCGIILFVLMAGFLPFDDSNLMNLYKKINRADLKFPPWFPSGPRKLIKKLLNPNPSLRITISQIYQDPWFRKNYKSPIQVEDDDVNLEDVTAVFGVPKDRATREQQKAKPAFFNAFDLISLSKGLNLSGLFEKQQNVKHELHFTSMYPALEIVSKIEEAAKPFGLNVKRQNYKMKLQGAAMGSRRHLSIATEVFEIAPSLFVVEVQKAGGDTVEYHNFVEKFIKGIKDIIIECGTRESKH